MSGLRGCDPKIQVIGEMQKKKSGRGPVGAGRGGQGGC